MQLTTFTMTQSKGNILIVDDDIDILETARMFLKQYYTRIDITQDPSQIPSKISRVLYDVILLDMNFRKGRNDGEEGFYWLSRILEFDPDAVVILITAYGEIDLAVKAIKEGAIDFVLKPWKNQKLLATVMAGWNLKKSKKEVKRLQETNQRIQDQRYSTGIVGSSEEIKKVNDLIVKVADTDANILILGENGTGKELVARALHTQSHRVNQPFIKVDAGAIPESLFESEIFGHVKGAFTDAKQDRIGSFEMASGGTLFLDEIGNINLAMQAKLLSVLENKSIRKVGSNTDIEIDVRIVAATNASLTDLVVKGEFRQDLLYRLNTLEILVPALRQRRGDIRELFIYFFKMFCKKYHKDLPDVSDNILSEIEAYNWPGNVRELQHAVERAIILESNGLSADDLIARTSIKADQHPQTLNEMERSFIIRSLDENGGNVTLTAKKLGLTRTAMYRRLKKYGL